MNIVKSFSSIGVIFILIGIVLILIPIIINVLPTVEEKKIPWILLYIYKSDGFFFATSPLLIIIGMIYFLKTFFF